MAKAGSAARPGEAEVCMVSAASGKGWKKQKKIGGRSDFGSWLRLGVQQSGECLGITLWHCKSCPFSVTLPFPGGFICNELIPVGTSSILDSLWLLLLMLPLTEGVLFWGG